MMKAGLIEEMMSDAIDSAIGGEDEEEETEEEVQKVLDEIALATASALPSAQVRAVRVRTWDLAPGQGNRGPAVPAGRLGRRKQTGMQRWLERRGQGTCSGVCKPSQSGPP